MRRCAIATGHRIALPLDGSDDDLEPAPHAGGLFYTKWDAFCRANSDRFELRVFAYDWRQAPQVLAAPPIATPQVVSDRPGVR